jgi:hypothetical protein
MSKDSPYSDWRVTPLKYLVMFFERFVTGPVRSIFVQLFLTISPSIPVDLRKSLRELDPKRLFSVSFGIAVFFCLFVTAFLCFIEGTLFGSDPAKRYFTQDWWNISLYLLICPTYCALSCCLIARTIKEWSILVDYADAKATHDPRPRSSYRFYAVFFLALLLSTIFITNYLDDVLNPTVQDAAKARIYWFMTDLGGGHRTLNRVGYYYVALNFSLLFLTLLGVACFLSLAAEVMRAGSAEDPNQIDSFEVLYEKLQSFTVAYLLMKGLAAAYTVNFFIWAVSPLGKTENLLAAQIALTVVGFFFIAVPRQYIELKWFELWSRSGKPFEFRETRSVNAKRLGGLLDALFITSILSAWKFDFPSITEWLSR